MYWFIRLLHDSNLHESHKIKKAVCLYISSSKDEVNYFFKTIKVQIQVDIKENAQEGRRVIINLPNTLALIFKRHINSNHNNRYLFISPFVLLALLQIL